MISLSLCFTFTGSQTFTIPSLYLSTSRPLSIFFSDPFQRRSVRALESISGILSREEAATKKADIRHVLVEEWKFVSRVMDRTLFIVFTSSALIFNISILTSSPFRERFDYCPLDEPEGCDDLTIEEILSLTEGAATSAHFGAGHEDDYGGGGDHGAPAAHHLKEDTDSLLSIQQHTENSQGGDATKEEPHAAIPGPYYEGYEGLGLLVPGSAEAQRLKSHNPMVALPGPAYEGYEGLGLLVPGSREAERILAGHNPLVPLPRVTTTQEPKANTKPLKAAEKEKTRQDDESKAKEPAQAA